MPSQPSGAEDPVGVEPQSELRDAQKLEEAMRGAISKSPDAFLMTADDLADKESNYWEREIRSSTWAVVQRGDEIVGFAAARLPDDEMDRDVNPAEARFIESVWIAPEHRGERLAERLMRFLFEVECAKSPSVRRFLLWVFDENDTAIRLYERMGFTSGVRQEVADGRAELRYEYRLEGDAGVQEQTSLAARQNDLRTAGLVYRVLGGDTS
jgi:ribosomal protein S18 acetylase RimI-like enzyme